MTYKEFEQKWRLTNAPYSGVKDGWIPTLEKLMVRLTGLGMKPEAVLQIKEKFGALRFYISNGTEEMHDAIMQAENASSQICEDCGEPGRLREGAWLKTLCDHHAGGRKPFQWSPIS